MKTKIIMLSALIFLFSCKKEATVEPTKNLKINQTLSNIQVNNATIDSIAELRSEFRMDTTLQTIPANSLVKTFNTVAEARTFLTMMEVGDITVSKNPPPTNARISSSTFSSGLWGSTYFNFYVPNMVFTYRGSTFNWPSGFVIGGHVEATGWQYPSSGTFMPVTYELTDLSANIYGLTFAMSWVTKGVSHTKGGANTSHIDFQGTLSVVVVIKNIGTIYQRPVRGLIKVQFGPYLRADFPNIDPSESRNKILSAFITR